MAPLFLPIAVIFGYIFSRYDDQGRTLTGKGRLFLLPVAIQSSIFIILLCVPLFLKKHNITLSEWLPLIAIPFVLQISDCISAECCKKKVAQRLVSNYLLNLHIISGFAPLASFTFPDTL